MEDVGRQEDCGELVYLCKGDWGFSGLVVKNRG